MMNLQDTMVSPPLLGTKKKKPVHEQFGEEYLDSQVAMAEIMGRKQHRQNLRLMQKEEQYSSLRLQDDWAEKARSLYYSESEDVQD